MSMTMLVWDAKRLIGELVHDSTYNLFSFQYDAAWIQGNGYQLSPHLPVVHDPNVGREVHSAIVRNFFQNLLPEGSALDDAATTYHVSKSNLLGILNALGREAAGAFVFTAVSKDNSLKRFKEERPPRLLSFEELSERIRSRPGIPFTVWDGRLRLSIAGYQDKLAAMYINQSFITGTNI
jgi:serine/threonine-protein kinase HipA